MHCSICYGNKYVDRYLNVFFCIDFTIELFNRKGELNLFVSEKRLSLQPNQKKLWDLI